MRRALKYFKKQKEKKNTLKKLKKQRQEKLQKLQKQEYQKLILLQQNTKEEIFKPNLNILKGIRKQKRIKDKNINKWNTLFKNINNV